MNEQNIISEIMNIRRKLGYADLGTKNLNEEHDKFIERIRDKIESHKIRSHEKENLEYKEYRLLIELDKLKRNEKKINPLT